MGQIEEIVAEMRRNPKGIRFRDLRTVCDSLFGKARQGAAIAYTRLRGREIRASISRITKAWPKRTRSSKSCERLNDWRHKVALKNDRYTYRVTWSADDTEYVGLCAEFPSLSWLASTPEAALRGIRTVAAEVVADLAARGEPVPEPLATRHYSGRFVVRVPPDLHRQLTIEATEAGVSLNRLAGAKLSK